LGLNQSQGKKPFFMPNFQQLGLAIKRLACRLDGDFLV